jgi:hypothetical protein
MTNRNTILNELLGLESTLVTISPQNLYQAPDGYFEGLANQVINRIKAMEVSDVSEEIKALSPLLSQADRKTPYSVSDDYFSGLEEKLMQGVRNHADYQTSKEELASISPLLNSISKKPLYAVPGRYFENLTVAKEKRQDAKVISITGRKWHRLAAAAVITGIIFTGFVVLLTQKNIDPNSNPHAWVEKKMKKVDTDEINNFVKLADDEANSRETIVAADKSAEVKDLMKDVSDKEIQQFLEETDFMDEPAEDVMMN